MQHTGRPFLDLTSPGSIHSVGMGATAVLVDAAAIGLAVQHGHGRPQLAEHRFAAGGGQRLRSGRMAAISAAVASCCCGCRARRRRRHVAAPWRSGSWGAATPQP